MAAPWVCFTVTLHADICDAANIAAWRGSFDWLSRRRCRNARQRLQFAFTVSFHIIFPAFTVGLAAWLAVLEALSLAAGRPVYRRLFDYWLGIFGVAFGMGVVSGIVMAFRIRHQLERAGAPDRLHPGAAAGL